MREAGEGIKDKFFMCRLSNQDAERLDELAEAAGLNRSETIRLLIHKAIVISRPQASIKNPINEEPQ